MNTPLASLQGKKEGVIPPTTVSVWEIPLFEYSIGIYHYNSS
jgi:hypothetical protein